MIDKAQLIEMFEGMRAQTPWDVDSDLLWGYFFTGEEDALNRLSEMLLSMNYRLVEVRPDEQDRGYWLHVERVETHSPDSLHERNQELARIAETFMVNYDGMDVGPAPT